LRPGKCPECFGTGFFREYCSDCPHKYLEKHQDALEVQLMRRAIDWQNALSNECRFHVTLHDITAEEYLALKVLRSEQAKHMESKRANQNQ
jgi:hypothetical protein